MNPFEEHLEGMKAYEEMIGGGDPMGMATLTFITEPNNSVVPVTHKRIVTDFVLASGLSPTTYCEQCEFEAARINFTPTKGMKVTLLVSKAGATFQMQLWHGGIQPGGGIYRFMLVDVNYHG